MWCGSPVRGCGVRVGVRPELLQHLRRRACLSQNMFFILRLGRRGVTGSGWEFLKSPLWLLSGEELGDLEKEKGDQHGAGCGVGQG